jgi:hypothetical protein
MGIDFYDVYLQLESDFEIQILDDVRQVPAETVGDLFDVVTKALLQQHPERFVADPDYETKAWERFAYILVDQTGIDRQQVIKPAYFVRDLGLY